MKDEMAAGAKPGEFFGCILPGTFAGFQAEYRAARESAAIFDTNWHATFALSGPDRVRYLNAIVSNDVKSLGEGHGLLALLLNPQGRILAELEIFALADKLLVRTHASVRDRTQETLEKYIIMDDVELADVSDEFGSMAIAGPRAASLIEKAGNLKIATEPEFSITDTVVDEIPCQLVRRSQIGICGADLIARREHLAELWRMLTLAVKEQGGEPAGFEAYESLRLEARTPFFPADFNDTVIPHEAALENSHISFSKGCYTGQEIVERVRSRGHVNRLRVNLRFSLNTPPSRATRLHHSGNEIGLVTSSAYSPEAASAIGMGYVRKEYAEAGSELEIDGGKAWVR